MWWGYALGSFMLLHACWVTPFPPSLCLALVTRNLVPPMMHAPRPIARRDWLVAETAPQRALAAAKMGRPTWAPPASRGLATPRARLLAELKRLVVSGVVKAVRRRAELRAAVDLGVRLGWRRDICVHAVGRRRLADGPKALWSLRHGCKMTLSRSGCALPWPESLSHTRPVRARVRAQRHVMGPRAAERPMPCSRAASLVEHEAMRTASQGEERHAAWPPLLPSPVRAASPSARPPPPEEELPIARILRRFGILRSRAQRVALTCLYAPATPICAPP